MLDKLALLLTIVGGLNWGSIGIFQFDLVAAIFGGQDAWGSPDRVYGHCPGCPVVHFPVFPGYLLLPGKSKHTQLLFLPTGATKIYGGFFLLPIQ